MTASRPSKVSVGMPVYNGSEYISEAIDSVLKQTYKNFSLIICDNCSTDNTAEIIKKFQDPRIRYVRNSENIGIVGNANRCLELSDGQYVGIFHHDDIMLPDNLEYKVQLLDEHQELGLVHSNISLIDPKGSVISPNIWCEDSQHDYIDNGFRVFQRYLEFLPRGASMFIGAAVFRKKCYDQLGGFEPQFPHCHDSEMWMRISLFHDVACIGRQLVKYRVHPTSVSRSWGEWDSVPFLREHYEVTKLIFKKYEKDIPNCKELISKTVQNFGKRALYLANQKLLAEDYAAAADFINEAVFYNPEIKKTKAFWKIKAKLAVGPKAVKFYRKIVTRQ